MNSSWFSLLFQFFSLTLVLTHDVLNWIRFILFIHIIVIFIAGIFFNSLWIFDQFFLNHFWQKFYGKYFFVCEWNFDPKLLYLFIPKSLSLSQDGNFNSSVYSQHCVVDGNLKLISKHWFFILGQIEFSFIGYLMVLVERFFVTLKFSCVFLLSLWAQVFTLFEMLWHCFNFLAWLYVCIVLYNCGLFFFKLTHLLLDFFLILEVVFVFRSNIDGLSKLIFWIIRTFMKCFLEYFFTFIVWFPPFKGVVQILTNNVHIVLAEHSLVILRWRLYTSSHQRCSWLKASSEF